MRDNTNPLLTDRPNEYGDELMSIVAGQQQELADFRRIRALLVRALLRAIGERDEGVITDPLTAACAHAKRVELLRAERDALAKEKALDGFCAHMEVLCGDCTNEKGFAIWHRPPTCEESK